MKPYNVLLITADDLNYNSLNCFGSTVPNLSPNLDALCQEGTTFTNAHVTIGLCQPSRSAIMTGRYPFKNGARGFEDIDASCTTLTQHLHTQGYYNAIIGKETHLSPPEKFFWDRYVCTYTEELDYGRNPSVYYREVQTCLAEAQGRPFFLMVNSHDPHRPFAGSDDEIDVFGKNLPCDHHYSPSEVNVPACLPELAPIREEMAQYYSSVRRLDQAVGCILNALKEQGVYDQTVILFLSDNGMSIPFCKTNCYINSTKSPYILRLPPQLQIGQQSTSESLINGIDIAPTLLELLELPLIEGMDGQSFYQSVYTPGHQYQDDIYTMFFKTAGNKQTKRVRHYPMRAVVGARYVYIYNGWADGETEFINESRAGLSFAAMQEAAKNDPDIAARVELFLFRVQEELYDKIDDPECLQNLVDAPEMTQTLAECRKRMQDYMLQSQDGFLDSYKKHLSGMTSPIQAKI